MATLSQYDIQNIVMLGRVKYTVGTSYLFLKNYPEAKKAFKESRELFKKGEGKYQFEDLMKQLDDHIKQCEMAMPGVGDDEPEVQ